MTKIDVIKKLKEYKPLNERKIQVQIINYNIEIYEKSLNQSF